MREISEYMILTSVMLGDVHSENDTAETTLANQVEIALGDGWQPFGAPWTWKVTSQLRMSQAMVKYADAGQATK